MTRITLVFIFIFLTACGSSSNTTDQTPVVERIESNVLSTFPSNNEALVSVKSVIKVVLDKGVDVDVLQDSFSITGGVQGTWLVDENSKTATFTPTEELAYAETYTVTMVASPATETGSVLSTDYSWKFITQSESFVQKAIENQVVILDLSSRNSASNSSTKSLKQAMDIMGMPYAVTDNVSTAVNSPILYTSSYIATGTLTATEKQMLNEFVHGGGIFVATSLSDSDLYSLFGVSSQSRKNTRSLMDWNISTKDPVLVYIDDPKEIQISLGGGKTPDYIYTRSYELDTATDLASFNDGSTAVTKHTYGAGLTYLLGVSYTDIIIRNQMNLDFDAERSYLNDFEPTTDTFMLFLRAIYEENIAHASWKHTSPSNSAAPLIITHDVDSQSSADWMKAFSDLETQKGVSVNYNINTHYIDDVNDGDYYTMNNAIYQYVLDQGHVISSHSVGHFRDWDDEVSIPLGSAGNTIDNYWPSYDGTVSSNATVYGELEVSKNLLENDLNINVKTFRSGHLLWNDNQVSVMEDLGYKYDSSFSANNILTNFPYRLLYKRAASSDLSSIYEFPLIISDGDYENLSNAVALWLDILGKNTNNSALTVLLIHPNRESKLNDLESFLDQLPESVVVRNMDDFGDYWQARDSFDFLPTLENNKLTLRLSDGVSSTTLNKDLSIMVKEGATLNEIDIVLSDNTKLNYIASTYNNSLILHNFKIE